MQRIVIVCYGVLETAGPQAAADITREFAEHRQWHKEVRCSWDGSRLVVDAIDECDHPGLALALQGEFSDCLYAFLGEWGEIKIESITPIGS